MTLQLMYITNQPSVAKIAQQNGVDRIFVDLESIGKEKRQPGDSVKSNHTVEDVKKIKEVLTTSKLLVRVNSIYTHSKEEIDGVIDNGADIVMLPYFKTIDEVKQFIGYVNKRAKVNLLVETPEAVDLIDDILELNGIDEIHIGLNDLHLGYHMKFLFELLCDGTVEKLCNKFKSKNIVYGFGGFGQISKGDLPAEYIIGEHYRLGSSIAILSRSFCDQDKVKDILQINDIFEYEMKKIREYENNINNIDLEENLQSIKRIVSNIVEKKS